MKLKELMTKRNVAQNEMAKILNVSRSSVYKYQEGKAEPNIETLIKIADYFDISLDNLCERPRPYDLPTAATQEQRQAVNLIMQLDATNTLRVISYCAGLLTNQN